MNIKQAIKEGRISFLFLLVVVFLLPVSRELFVIALWPWVFFRLLEGVLNKGFPGKMYQKGQISIYFLPVFFFLLLLSLLWSNNGSEGMEHMGRSLLMIIFPLVLGTDIKVIENHLRIKQLLKIYVLGASVSLIFLWTYALVYSISFENGRIVFDPLVREWENAFFHKAFSFLIHPTYFGMMILMAVAVSLQEIKAGNLFSKSPFWPLLMSIILTGSLFFISSRAMIVAGIVLVIYYLIFRITNTRILLFSLLISIVTFFLVASIHPRFRNFHNLVDKGAGIFSYEHFRESTDRGKTWEASWLLITENPILGVGVGDVRESLTGKYLELGFYSESDNYLNCHNQFLETWLAAGIAGFIWFCGMLFYPLIGIKLHHKFLYGSFIIICMVAFLFESVLDRLWGVAFFSLFYLLLTRNKSE